MSVLDSLFSSDQLVVYASMVYINFRNTRFYVVIPLLKQLSRYETTEKKMEK